MKLKFRADSKDIVIFLIFCFFLLYLIALGVLNLSSFSKTGQFYGLNPIEAFSSEYIVATLLFFIIALVALFTSCSSLFFERESGFGVTTQKKSKNDGYSKLWEAKDMKKAYDVKKIHLSDDDYQYAGFPLVNNGKNAWVDSGENHSLIMGASGSGKSQCFMHTLIKILGRAGESMIVTDPKGELYEECGNLLKDKGYKIIILNFRDPDEGAAWNPFTYPYNLYKSGNVDKANELLQDLSTNILIDPNNRAEPFWENTASNYFTGLSLGLFEDAKEEEININSINMMAEIGGDRLGASTYEKEYFRAKGELSPAYISAASCINAPNETKGSIMSTFRTKTRMFSSQQNLSEMLSHSDFDIRDIGKEKTAVFLKVHDEKTTYHALATIFVKQVYESLIAVAQTCPDLKLPYRTNFVLDEFANMPPLKDVESMITASRSRRIRFSFVIQNYSQLNKVYGKEVADTIKGNCGNFVYLMSTELAALEEISKLCGDIKPPKPKKDEPAQPIRPLVTVSDLQAFEKWEVLINRFRNQPFKTRLSPNFEITWGKTYSKMGYPKRTKTELKVFDLKGFVNKMKQENGGMPGATGAPMGGFGASANPFGGYNPMANQGFQGGALPGAMPTNLDDYVKKLDEKIAELEAEEAAEKAKEEAKKDNNANVEKPVNIEKEENKALSPATPMPDFVSTPKPVNQSPVSKPVETEISPSVETSKEESTGTFVELNKPVNIKVEEPVTIENISNVIEKKPADNKFVSTSLEEESQKNIEDLLRKVENKPERELEEKEEIEKPIVNVDPNTINVNDNVNNEDFFDDFFGSDDE